jgi:CRP/FNR family transcriptional regulator, cyclic AMP receptor protein
LDTAQQLAHIPLFESLTDEERGELARGLEEKIFEAGATIFNQGDEGGELYIVEDGAVDISIVAGNTTVTVASLFAGQYFGELSLFDGMPRSATAKATKPTRLLWLGRDDLVRFIDTNPEGAMKILAEMSNRMRKTNELMSSQVSRNVIGEHDEQLTLGDRIADKVASFGGSWAFILCFVGVIAFWMLVNLIVPYDRPGFLLLNLVLAVVAAGQAPVIMMSQNRQETKAKLLAENDYQVNLKNELGIANLQKSVAELLQRTAMLERQVTLLAPKTRDTGSTPIGPSS